ncbi:unnamed protein product [Sphagnum jensenii]|uniref:Uncharacterized protein n=1 Tax=Sphagnum jensenii TaxID=128206 RepID=A0ABP1A638_9BRYO
MQAQDGDHGFEKMIVVGGAFVDTNDCHHDFGKVSYVPFAHSVTLALHMDLTLWEKDLVVLTIFFCNVLGAAPSMVREDHLCNQGQGCYV